jgi:DNA-binding response OmpR family regulator
MASFETVVKILVVEDESGLRDSIREYFTEGGNICETASDYASALQKINLYRYDCILLDITLPNGNGLDILEALKANHYPDGVLIISARNSLDDRLQGLDLGADDYLTKPFHLSELKARVMAIVRRKSFNGNRELIFHEIAVDLLAKQASVSNIPVKLTRKEYALLLYFLANQGKVISKNAIAEHLWGDEIDISDNFDFIYSHIKNLRKKLIDAGSGDYIQSAYGMGYKFTDH